MKGSKGNGGTGGTGALPRGGGAAGNRGGEPGRGPRGWRWLLPGVLALAVLLGVLAEVFCPRPVWIVEGPYVSAWREVLASSPSPLAGARIIAVSPGAPPPRGPYYGYRIFRGPLPPESGELPSGSGPAPGETGTSPGSLVRVYRNLPGAASFEGALPLAFNPWLVFRKFFDPPLSRERVEAAGDSRGRLLLPGGDQAARGAWTAQFLQEQPGRFSPDREAWEGGEEALFEGQRFQQGARTYSWVELWPVLLAGNEEDQGEPVWVYGPLSRIRALPLHETNILEADPFPGKTGWTEFGVEAEILWAAPYGRPWFDGKVLDRTGTWLRDMETQIRWAAALGWVAAHRDAPPHNPVSAAARVIWLTSSYVWERGSPGE